MLCDRPRAAPAQPSYRDGVEIETYSEDRTLDKLTSYLETHSRAYIRDVSDAVVAGADGGSAQAGFSGAGAGGINERGESMPLDRQGLEQAREKGPVFVKFYAPWWVMSGYRAGLDEARLIRGSEI